MVNNKQTVEKLFHDAVFDDDGVECYEADGNRLGYFVEEYGYERFYYFDETESTLENRIVMDKEVEDFLDKKALSKFLCERLDSNSLMALEKMVFVFDNGEDYSKVRQGLAEEYGDEYALYVSEDCLGMTWVDRQIVVVNVSELVESSVDIANEPDEMFSAEYIFSEGLLQTIFHECRHLFYECNEIVQTGIGTEYPADGGIERKVEEYGNDMAEKYIGEFNQNCIKNTLSNSIEKMREALGLELCEEKEI